FSLRRQPVGSHHLRDHFGAVARRRVARVLDPRAPCHTTRSDCGPARGIASASICVSVVYLCICGVSLGIWVYRRATSWNDRGATAVRAITRRPHGCLAARSLGAKSDMTLAISDLILREMVQSRLTGLLTSPEELTSRRAQTGH